jgi:hypothetical protein
VLRNLVTCDCNLMLSSGLPMSLDPQMVSDASECFISHPSAQLPGDLRITALVELVVLIHRATKGCGQSSSRHLDSFHLTRLNTEMDKWERKWSSHLCQTESQHNRLPFNSLRWYRLALNSAPLGELLAATEDPGPIQVTQLQSLDISLKAATQILLSLSEKGWQLWTDERQTEWPSGPFMTDRCATAQLAYAVDSTWISLTFAIAFIIICYVRGIVDGR